MIFVVIVATMHYKVVVKWLTSWGMGRKIKCKWEDSTEQVCGINFVYMYTCIYKLY